MAKPKNLKEILTLLRDYSQLMVELGYAAVLEDSYELAQEAIRIKGEIKDLDYELRKEALMVARLSKYSREDIPQIANILQIGVAIKEISDGIDDLIEIAMRNVGVHPIIKMAYTSKDKRMIRYEVEPESRLDGKKLEEVEIDIKTGFRVTAIRRDKDWTLDPRGATRVKCGDILIVQGREVSIRKMQDYVKGKKKETQK